MTNEKVAKGFVISLILISLAWSIYSYKNFNFTLEDLFTLFFVWLFWFISLSIILTIKIILTYSIINIFKKF